MLGGITCADTGGYMNSEQCYTLRGTAAKALFKCNVIAFIYMCESSVIATYTMSKTSGRFVCSECDCCVKFICVIKKNLVHRFTFLPEMHFLGKCLTFFSPCYVKKHFCEHVTKCVGYFVSIAYMIKHLKQV